MVVENLADMFRGRAAVVPVTTTSSPRRYELDWLRVIIILGAIVFHAVYEMQVYFPQARSVIVIQVGYAFAIEWGWPLLFLIAGASAWLSLAHRTGRQFIKERVLHLLVPFIGCVLTVIPVTLYLAALIRSRSHVPFFQFYADYFQSYTGFFRGNPFNQLIAYWGNLWFIIVIFLVSLLVLPLLLLLKGSRGKRVIAGCARVCQMPGGTLVAGALFIVCAWFLGMVIPATAVNTLWLAAVCVLSFIAGVLLYADPSIERAILRDGPYALVLATFCFVAEQVLVSANALPMSHSGGYALSAILAGGIPWFGAIAFLGVGKRFFSFTNEAIEYLKVAALPYFLLHMLMLALFGYIFLRQTNLPGVVQSVAIMTGMVLSLALLYEFLIRRNAFLRLVFGVKSRPHA